MPDAFIVIVLAVLVAICALGLALGFYLRCRRLRVRYGPITGVDARLNALRNELQRAQSEQQQFLADAGRQRKTLTEQYAAALSKYEALKREVSVLDDNLEDISFGLYRPHFKFDSSAEYRARLE